MRLRRRLLRFGLGSITWAWSEGAGAVNRGSDSDRKQRQLTAPWTVISVGVWGGDRFGLGRRPLSPLRQTVADHGRGLLTLKPPTSPETKSAPLQRRVRNILFCMVGFIDC